MRLGDGRRRLHAGRSGPAPPRHGGMAPHRTDGAPPRTLDHAHAGEGHRRRIRRAGLRADSRLRRIRFSGKPRGELRVDRLRDRLAQVPLSRRISCSLLNAQPMGFYTPATIVEDAKRHGVVVRSIDVQSSDWDCTLERCTESAGGFAVRMGLRYVKGLGEGEWREIAAARADRAPSPRWMISPGAPDWMKGASSALAEAGAFDSLQCGPAQRAVGRCAA